MIYRRGIIFWWSCATCVGCQLHTKKNLHWATWEQDRGKLGRPSKQTALCGNKSELHHRNQILIRSNLDHRVRQSLNAAHSANKVLKDPCILTDLSLPVYLPINQESLIFVGASLNSLFYCGICHHEKKNNPSIVVSLNAEA